MDREQLKRIIDSPDAYDDVREESYIAWARGFFHDSQWWAVALVFVHFLGFCLLAVLCGILFVNTDSTKYQIMYAAFFVCLVLIAYLIKVFAWVMASRNSIKRDIKRLELRLLDLDETLKSEFTHTS